MNFIEYYDPEKGIDEIKIALQFDGDSAQFVLVTDLAHITTKLWANYHLQLEIEI